jgi:hypothetical protein
MATLAWWIIPVVVRSLPRHDEISTGFVLVCLFALTLGLILCALFRQARWIVLVWVPLLAWSGIGTLKVIGAIASEPHGGPNAAPLEGVATLIALVVALILGAATILCLVWRPRVYSVPLMILAIANTAAFSYTTRQSNRQATRQDIFLHVLDSNGRPISGASIQYTRYGYGPGGENVFDAKGGPILSDENGIAKIPSRKMRYETECTITKSGFRDVRITLGMQFSEWDKDRDVRISTSETEDIAWAHIPTTDPVTFSIYLSPQSDAPDPLHPVKRMELEADIGQGSQAKHVLNLETGKFSNGPEGDLRFDLFSEMVDDQFQKERTRLRITGVNGSKVLQVPPEVSLSGTLSPYEHIFRIAPQTGYQDETVIQNPGSSPGPMIYVSARDGHIYARARVDVYGSANNAKAGCSVELFVNPTGSRQLEFPKTSGGLHE